MLQLYDRLAPGAIAKLNLGIDGVLVAAIGLLFCGVGPAYVMTTIVAVALWVTCATVLRLYSPFTPRSTLDTFALHALVATLIGIATHTVHVPGEDGPPFSALELSLWIFVATALNRAVLQRLRPGWGEPLRYVVVVGNGPLGRTVCAQLEADPTVEVVGVVRWPEERTESPREGIPVLGEVEQLLEILSRHAVGEVYVAGDLCTHARAIREVVATCERVGMPFALPVNGFRLQRAEPIGGVGSQDGFVHYQESPPKPVQYAIKRMLDIVLAAMALLALLPLLLVVAVAIKLTSRGPVFYWQTRIGLHGVPFRFYKFRSMVVGAHAMKAQLAAYNEVSGPVFKIRNDPRVTTVGRWIRRFSVDELPQLVNVLRGDMSLVGPRPPLPEEVTRYTPEQRRRLSVRPGITCIWQVNGRNEVSFDEWMKMDLDYVDRWSLGLDAVLMLKTLPAVLSGRGAS